jgi:nucleoside-diphosphate-sugar epimerase
MTISKGLVTIFGYGPTGEATADRLRARGAPVRVVQRRRPVNLPAGIEFMQCDVLDAGQVLCAMTGAEQGVVTIGFDYKGSVWKQTWPHAMANLIAAAEATNARIVHVDNMYMYGPQDVALHEDMPLTNYGVKPAVRAEVTCMWQTAARQGRVRWAALRAPDFYGPGVGRAHLGDTGLGLVAQGRAATLLMAPDQPHAFAYVPDIGRAAVTLLDAPDNAFNQVWHVPCAPTRTARQLLEMGADAVGQKLRLISVPSGLLPVLGVVIPFIREYAEMRFTWDRPYHVDATKFARRFWSDATPFEVGVPQAVRAFRAALLPKTEKKSGGRTPAGTATP